MVRQECLSLLVDFVVMRAMEVRYRYRLRLNAVEQRALQDVFDACRFAWNQALGRWSDLWRHEGLLYSYADAGRELTDWRGRFRWLSAQPSVPQQQVIRDLYKSIAAFFDTTNPAGRPKFKSRKSGYATARWTRSGFKVTGSGCGAAMTDRLCLAVAGGRVSLRVVWSRLLPSDPSSVTVYRDTRGRWWASFVCRLQVPDAPLHPTGRATGLDMGLETFATTEEPDACIGNPRHAKQAEARLRRANRYLARTQPASGGRRKARKRKARIEATVADQRADFHNKAARRLVAVYDRIGVEDLRVKSMARKGRNGKARRKAGLNRSIADAGWSQFQAVLAWQATKAGKQVVVLPARDTTQKCSSCGAKAKPRIELSERVFRCRACGLVLGRDRNAARNLNPDRPGPGGGTEPSGHVLAGDDGNKTPVPVGPEAARAPESDALGRGSSQSSIQS